MVVGFAPIPGVPVGLTLSALVPFCGLSVVVVSCAIALALPRTVIAAAASRALRMHCLLGLTVCETSVVLGMFLSLWRLRSSSTGSTVRRATHEARHTAARR